jgi:curved DNA-binding protein CbpA
MSVPSIAQCYRILDLSEGADLDAVKSAYRRLAFRYHPDLHPQDAAAAERFARINEAYVTLKRHLERKAAPGQRPSAPGSPRPEKKTRETASSPRPDFFSPRQEEILRDILNDPFAKQVFEEIFRKLRRGDPIVEDVGTPTPPPAPPASSHWKTRISQWFRHQLDVEHSMELPAQHLTPGARLRLDIRLPLSLAPRTVEFTLPHDFRLGKPIRLRGLGRRLGPWKGDLLLRLYAAFPRK